MNPITDKIGRTFVKFSRYTYSNLGRLFLRLFVGVMFIQFGIRQLVSFSELRYVFPSILGMSSETCLIVMICIELICSLLIMVGFLTRISCIPPIISMIFAEYYIIHNLLADSITATIDCTEPGYLPIMFIGIYSTILLLGPGKISVDYFLAYFYLEDTNKTEREVIGDQ